MTVVGNGLALFRLFMVHDCLREQSCEVPFGCWRKGSPVQGKSPFPTKAAVAFDGMLFIEMFKQLEVIRRQPTLILLGLAFLPMM